MVTDLSFNKNLVMVIQNHLNNIKIYILHCLLLPQREYMMKQLKCSPYFSKSRDSLLPVSWMFQH